MSTYTTGELAKRCNVSVRTVQYYDERGILVPTEVSEGGRRLFSDADVETLETICFLRDLDISIKSIAEILKSDESQKAIELLMQEQEKELREEIQRKNEQLDRIKGIKNYLVSFKDGSQNVIHDISKIMEKKEKQKAMYRMMLAIGLPLEMAEIVTFLLGILKGIWIPFLVALGVMVIAITILFNYWYKRTAYICPECHLEYRPGKTEAFFAAHTPKMRKLTCPSCKRKIWSLEVYSTAPEK